MKQASVANSRRGSVNKELKAAEASVADLTEKVAALSAELLVLRKDDQARLQREAVDARRHDTERRKEEEFSSAIHKADIKVRNDLQRRAETAELAAADAQRLLEEAQADAARAREDAIAEAEAAELARTAQGDAEYLSVLSAHQAERAKAKSAEAARRVEELGGHRNRSRSPEEWAALKEGALRVARHREMIYLRGLLESHGFRAEELATVLSDLGMLKTIIFQCREGFDLYFEAVQALTSRLQDDDFGEQFALFMHYELRMPLPLIHRLVQAGCKTFDRKANDGAGSYESKYLLHHPWVKKKSVKVEPPPLASCAPLAASRFHGRFWPVKFTYSPSPPLAGPAPRAPS